MSRSLGLTPTLAAGSGGHDKGAAGQPQKVVFDLHRPVVDEGILDAGALLLPSIWGSVLIDDLPGYCVSNPRPHPEARGVGKGRYLMV